MEQRSFRVELLAPAFLGDAHQKPAWRAPPLKAQLRRWWRVAMYAHGVDRAELRRLEGQLLGGAAGPDDRKSRVRLRLRAARGHYGDEWLREADSKRLKMAAGTNAVGYLAFGRAKTKGANDQAIPAGEHADLHLAWPPDEEGAQALPEALGLIDRLGTLGGRSSNGWGSCVLGDAAPAVALTDYARPWREALDEPWLHALGQDEAGLLAWRTTTGYSSWEGAIRDLADVRKALCGNAGPLRPLMSWPVTGTKQHAGMEANDRIPNTLRFRLVRNAADDLRGQIVHLPCRPSDEIWQGKLTPSDRRAYPEVWQAAHRLLDGMDNLERVHQ